MTTGLVIAILLGAVLTAALLGKEPSENLTVPKKFGRGAARALIAMFSVYLVASFLDSFAVENTGFFLILTAAICLVSGILELLKDHEL